MQLHHIFVLRYDGSQFISEVGVNYVLWEKHERNGYKYSATMKQVQSSQQE